MPTSLPLPFICPVIVMAKSPRPGYAKTRLVPALGAKAAADLAQQLLAHALEQAVRARLGPVELCCAPDASDPLLAPLRSPQVALQDQGEGDLGQRMQRAFARWLPTSGCALLMGTDIPGLDAPTLQQAALALSKHDAVFIPALDGGYGLIGLRGASVAPFSSVFEEMTWSNASVMSATRQRLAAAGLSHAELPPLADIDEPADLQHVPAAWLP
jgi:rSAM/selenodomain-associated transferase 1